MLANYQNISNIILGGVEAERVYLGDELVYEKRPKYVPLQFVGTLADGGSYLITCYTDDGGKYSIDLNPDMDGKFDVMVYSPFVVPFLSGQFKRIDHITVAYYESYYRLFEYQTELENIDLRGIVYEDNVWANLYGMFQHCEKLSQIDLSPMSSVDVASVEKMFSYCSSLKKIALGSFTIKGNTYSMFYNCTALQNFSCNANTIGTSLDFSDCPLTLSSAISVISGLQTGGGNITFNNATYSQLTQENLALATSKNWSIICS